MNSTKATDGIAKWRTTWPRLSPARRAVYVIFNALVSAFALGVVGVLGLVAASVASLPLALAVCAVAVAWVAWDALVDPLLPDDPSDRPLSATVVHQVAS